MEHNIEKLVSLVGNQHRYQYFIGIICFLFWFNTTMVSFSLGFLENKPLISYYDKDNNETIVEGMSYDTCDFEKNSYTTRILKWDTEEWGEIPADFGRK